MKRKRLTLLKGLLCAAFLGGVFMSSCDKEKPDIPSDKQKPGQDTVQNTGQDTVQDVFKPVQPLAIALADTMVTYLDGEQAVISLRTTPWNVLKTDSLATITLTDTLGMPVEQMYRFDSVRLMPDSTWTVWITHLDEDIWQSYITVTLTTAQERAVSKPLLLVRRDMLAITAVKVGQDMIMPDSAGLEFRYMFNTVIDLSSQKVQVYHTGDKVMLKDSITLNKNSYSILNLTNPLTLVVYKDGRSKEYTLAVTRRETGLPIVYIDTQGRKVNDRINWIDGIRMTIENPDGSIVFDNTLSMRGRGNSSWDQTDKKSYALKLDEKASVLGMSTHKRWILQANYKDYTLLRNDAAMWLSRRTALPYTINGRFVELVLNGQHRGNYYLCEQAKISSNRINTRKPDLDNPAAGGLLVEIDAFFNYYSKKEKKEELGFWSERFNMPYIFKDPDEDDIDSNSPIYSYFKDFVDSLEAILLDEERLKNHEYERYLDAGKAIDFALVQEITFNHDSYNTFPANGPHSTFLYIDTVGKLCFGPVWDFDYHTFMPNLYENKIEMTEHWVMLETSHKTSKGKYYFEYLLKDDKFRDSLVAHWDRYKDAWKELPDYIDVMVDSISESEQLNRDLWYMKTRNSQNNDRGPYKDAIHKMKMGFNRRWDWIDRNIRKL